jgi:hypothetical protein
LDIPKQYQVDPVVKSISNDLDDTNFGEVEDYQAAIGSLQDTYSYLQSLLNQGIATRAKRSSSANNSNDAIYTPDLPVEHYAAIFLPLIFPLAVPFLVSFMKEYKRYKQKKKEKETAAAAAATNEKCQGSKEANEVVNNNDDLSKEKVS